MNIQNALIPKKITKNKIVLENKNLIVIFINIYMIMINLIVLTGNFKLITSKYLIINIYILYSLISIIFFITKKIKISLIITNCLVYIFGVANYILIDIKASPLSLSDFFLIKSAINVIEVFDIKLNINFYISFLLFIVNIITIKFFIKEDKWLIKIDRNLILYLGIFTITIIWFLATPKLYYVTTESDSRYGTLYRFIKSTKNISLIEPEGYSEQKVQEILKKYELLDNSIINTDEEKPNIIVIMNESLADVNKVYNLNLEDNLSFINSLSNGTKLYSSSYGNKTANSEFEFLTGFSMIFYNRDIVPYQKYIKSKKDSLVQLMKKNNYKTASIHLYNSTSYNRKLVYEYFGFDESIFDDNIKNINLAKMCNSDFNTYKKIIELFENKDENEKLFNFTITLQNHIPYKNNFEHYKNSYPEYTKQIELFENNYENKYNLEAEDLSTYLNYANLSDKAFKYLIEYFKNYDEKTVIMMFGDHQPNLLDTFSDDEKNYLVSFSLWSNYNLDIPKFDSISINYLSTILTQIARIENTSFLNFLKELQKEVPVITSKGYMGKDGKWYDIGDKESIYYELLQEYNYLQYYYMSK